MLKLILNIHMYILKDSSNFVSAASDVTYFRLNVGVSPYISLNPKVFISFQSRNGLLEKELGDFRVPKLVAEVLFLSCEPSRQVIKGVIKFKK